MDRENWIELSAFIERANDVRSLMRKADTAGKQQLSLKDERLREWLADVGPSPSTWLKFGFFLARLALDEKPTTAE